MYNKASNGLLQGEKNQMHNFDYDQASKDDINTIVEIVYEGEWPPDVVKDIEPAKTEKLIDTGSFTIVRLHCKHFADREELLLLRALTEHAITAFTSIGL